STADAADSDTVEPASVALLETVPTSALPARSAEVRQTTLAASPTLRRLPDALIPSRRVMRAEIDPCVAPIANCGATRQVSISVSARAYSTRFPQSPMAMSSQQFSRSARIDRLSHHTAG